MLRVGPADIYSDFDNVAVFEHNYRAGAIYQKRVYELFSRFIDQFLIINLLAQNRGFCFMPQGLSGRARGFVLPAFLAQANQLF